MFSKLSELRSLSENDSKIKTNRLFSFVPSFIFQIKEIPKKYQRRNGKKKALEEESGTRNTTKTK